MAWLIILLLCLGISSAQILEVDNRTQPGLKESVLGLFLRLQKEKLYNTLLVYGKECDYQTLFRHLNVPIVLVTSGSTNFDWNFSSLTLIFNCKFDDEQEKNYRTLVKLQMNRRLILLQDGLRPKDVCQHYTKMEQYNIAMVKLDFHLSGLVYACRYFDKEKYEKLNIYTTNKVYIDQFRNMHGAAIRTITDKLAPRSMAYPDTKTGQERYMGFVANALNYFIEKVNATMVMPMNLTDGLEKISNENISKWIAEDRLDIGMSVTNSFDYDNFDTISYPFLMTSHCFMVPLPDQVPFSRIYMEIVDMPVLIGLFAIFCILLVLLVFIQQKSWKNFSLVKAVMNDICWRGFLALAYPFPNQSSRKLKLICIIIGFSSMITTTMFMTYLQSFLWAAPTAATMYTFGDFEKSRYKLAITTREVEMMRPFNISMKHLEIFENFNNFEYVRSTFDDNYIYPMTALRWIAFNEQQKFFRTPMFYYSDAFCLNLLDILSFPLRRHLPYRDLFEEHMLRQNEFGLTTYAIQRSFLDMLKLKITDLHDYSPPRSKDCLEVHNFVWVYCLYFAGLFLGCCCFFVEVKGWRCFGIGS